MITDYPITEYDQAKLFKANYVLVKSDNEQKKVTIVDPTGSTIDYKFPTQKALKNFITSAAFTSHTIINDMSGSIHKTSKTRLLADGYTFIRLNVQDNSIKAKTFQKDWHKIMDIPEGKDLITEFLQLLADSKTLQL